MPRPRSKKVGEVHLVKLFLSDELKSAATGAAGGPMKLTRWTIALLSEFAGCVRDGSIDLDTLPDPGTGPVSLSIELPADLAAWCKLRNTSRTIRKAFAYSLASTPAPRRRQSPALDANTPAEPEQEIPVSAKATNETPVSAKPAKAKPERAMARKIDLGRRLLDEKMELAALAFDRRLQTRDIMFNESTVQRYTKIYRDDPNLLPPLRVMEISQKEADSLQLESCYVVWDGFQRGEAANRAKLTKVRVTVVKGTFAQAREQMLANHFANHDAALPRNPADKRRSFHLLMNNKPLLAKVLKGCVGNGGSQRAMAAAAGCSKSLVNKILMEEGMIVQGDKLVPAHRSLRGHTITGADQINGESKVEIAKRLRAIMDDVADLHKKLTKA